MGTPRFTPELRKRLSAR